MKKMLKKDSRSSKSNGMSSIPANPKLISELFTRSLISEEARNDSLKFLIASKDWGLWVGRFFLLFGIAFILCAFLILNLVEEVPHLTKLISIQIALLACLGVSFACYSKQFLNNILILASSLLVGIFLLTFAIVYKTESHSYSLFMMWMILILPWTLVSNFASLWALWLVVANIFCFLYWKQVLFPLLKEESFTGIYPYLALINAIFLAFREYGVKRGMEWLQSLWTREVLTISILVYIMISLSFFTVAVSAETLQRLDVIGVAINVILAAIIYVIYRFKIPDFITSISVVLSLQYKQD